MKENNSSYTKQKEELTESVRYFFCCYKNCRIINQKLAISLQYGWVDLPVIKKQSIDLDNIRYRGFQNTRRFDERTPQDETVGFFIQDNKFQAVLNRPWNYVAWLKQYKQVMGPDVSCYWDMSFEEIVESVLLNRLISAFWQEQGLTVIATLSWGKPDTFDICFSGIEKGSVVAVSTIGTGKNKAGFMAGFIEMCQQIEPEWVICYCTPYPEMFQYVNILVVEHEGTREKRLAQNRPVKGQLDLFETMAVEGN